MQRTVTKTGSSLTVTLPAEWTDQHDLEPSDHVEVETHGDELIITTVDAKNDTITIPYKPALIDQLLQRAYEEGYDEIHVESTDEPVPELDEHVDQFPGLTTLTEDEQSITLGRTSLPNIKKRDAMLRRAFRQLRSAVQQNPPDIPEQATQLLLTLTTQRYKPDLISPLRDIADSLPAEQPYYDSAHAVIRDVLSLCYEQYYNFREPRSKKIQARLDSMEDIRESGFERTTNPAGLSDALHCARTLHNLHEAILREQSLTTIENVEQHSAATYSVGVCLTDLSNQFWHSAVKDSMETTANEYDMELDIRAPPTESDTAGQQEILEQFIHHERDAVIYVPVNNTEHQEVLRELTETTPLIVIDTPLAVDVDHTFIGFDDQHGGRMVGETVAEQLTADDTVLVVAGREHGNSAAREKGFKEALPDNCETVTVRGDYAKSLAFERTAAVLDTRSVDAIFAVSDNMAIGAKNAVQQSTQDPFISGFDYTREGRKALRNHEFLCDVHTKPQKLGRLAVQQAHDAVQGNTLPERITYDVELKTTES